MPFVVYLAVAAVAVFSVVLEWDTLVEPSAATRQAMHTVSRMAAPKPAADSAGAPRRVAPAVAATGGQTQSQSAQNRNVNARPADTVAPAAPPALTQAPADQSQASADPLAPPADAPPAPQCDVEACTQAYVSFRASDCTWQPYGGPRRLCTKGAAADNAPPDDAAANARADGNAPANPRCHYRTCAEHYSSFNPADCTYQPLDGPRRLCEK